MRKTNLRQWLASGAAAGVLSLTFAAPALAEQATFIFDQPSMPMSAALQSVGRETGVNILVDSSLVRDVRAKELRGQLSADAALLALLDGTGLSVQRTDQNSVMIVRADDPQSGSAAGDGADGTVEALIVTAQKREEDIQDVPIAISAFTQKDLEAQKIEGGFDLLKAIPNVTFSKNNFTSYNFSIRGIGTKAISATTDPGVAVAFNYSGLIQNRLFEQEYFDVERVEVLRGPQGTLYGRNATGGVINVISAKPSLDAFSGHIKGEVGSFDTKRMTAMVNVPLVEDVLAIRLAGALTTRRGYGFNSVTGNDVDGRDLWSARLTVGFQPTERLRADFIWERFEEDDNRARTSKQLCHHDAGPDRIGNVEITTPQLRALFSQGCVAGSLYEDAAFGTPNGLAIPFVFALPALMLDYPVGYDPVTGDESRLLGWSDPYGGMMQSRDLRTIASLRDPIYRAQADVFQLNIDIDVSDGLRLTSQTLYDEDEVYSAQDYNRFNTQPIFQDTSHLVWPIWNGEQYVDGPSVYQSLAPNGVFCDPQLGCSDTLVGFDISTASGRQFSQEIRLQSDFGSAFDFSVGANYTRFSVLADYYVMYNLLTATALMVPFNSQPDINICGPGEEYGCPYIDPNPLESINGEGHNYYRSKNPYKLTSVAAFGEGYWRVNPTLKVTAGLRYTNDLKTFIPVPSQVLLATNIIAGGTVNRGYPEGEAIKQRWGEVTGRLGIDWQPDLAFTDETMIYAFYSRGYKGGGANPPSIGLDPRTVAERLGLPPGEIPLFDTPFLFLTAANYPPTFRPEFVNAYELGSKSVAMGGALVFNTAAFFYDYEDYQVSKIVDRTAVNENFDARVWGLEFEMLLSPIRDLRVNANLGYLDTRIGKGAKSIDIMDRTAGNPAWMVVKPWVQLPSNCVIPTAVAENYAQAAAGSVYRWYNLCGGFLLNTPDHNPDPMFLDPTTGLNFDPMTYPEINGGAGIAKNLEGNELPNSPHWTVNVGAQYGIDILDGWRATMRGDAYWQSQSWARVYNSDPYDKLHGWYNVNLSVWIERPEDDLKIELYVKNALDETPITDAFLNSDDTALTTNVFVLDPRLIGLSIRKGF